LQENLATRIASKVNSGLSEDDRAKLSKQDTTNPEAKRLFLQGRYFLERQEGDDLIQAVKFFRQATDLDPLYAKAWSCLAETYSLISVPGHKSPMSPSEAANFAKAAVRKAIEIDDTAAEPYVSMAMVKLRYDWDWDGSEQEFREAISRNPELPPAHLGLSNLLILKGRYAESVAEAEAAKQLSPFSPMPDVSIARTLYFERNYEQMDKVLTASVEPSHKRLTYLRGLLFIQTGRLQEAIEIFEKLYEADTVYGGAPLALAYG
jgi:tetratricopeptide (TPR) repeat protein